MELRNLRAFVEVVRQGGFSPAAKTLFTTQSNVSKSVRLLEDELDCLLLDRIGHRSTLTEAGTLVYQRALAMLAERSGMIEDLDALRGMRRGTLRLGLPPVGSDILFAPVVAQYRKRYPDIDIRLVEHGGTRLKDMVRAGEIDLAAALLPVPDDEFAWKPVRREPIDALLAADHPLAKRKSLALAELAEVPFVLFEASFGLNQIVLDACAGSGFAPAIAMRSSQIDFLIELIAVKLGVTFLPRMIARQRAHPAVRRIAITDPAMEWNIALIWRRGGRLPQAAQAWMALTGK